MQNFDTNQLNNLMTGVKLAAELKSKETNTRRFITVFAYQYDEEGNYKTLSKFLKQNIEDDIFFELRVYELSNEYFENNWDICEEDLTSDIKIDGIKGLKNLESKLIEYLDDISLLQPEWNCDNPL